MNERIVTNHPFTHVVQAEDGREHPITYAAGQHNLPPDHVASARASGVIDEAATAELNAAAAPAKPKRIRNRKPAAKKPAAKKPAARK